MNIILTAVLAASNPLPDTGTVSSSNASYDGSALVLKGQVVLDHGLGKMRAEEAVLEKQVAGKDFPFSLIHLQKDVQLALKNSAELRCDAADFDFNALKGNLTSSERVTYTDLIRQKKGDGLIFRLMSKDIELQMIKNGETNFEIEQITAKETVQIDYTENFSIFADHAVYNKTSALATPKNAESRCHLKHGEDLVDATSIQVDLLHSKVVMSQPHGVIRTLLDPEAQKGDLRFTSDSLVWDHLKNTLILKGKIQMSEPSLGTLVAEDEVQLVQGKNLLSTIRTKGKTALQSLNHHKLLCFGSILIDRDHFHATIDSPPGALNDGHQIYYEENEIALFADKAAIEYAQNFAPVSIALKGNVRLFSRDPQKPPRMGLADRVTYSPTTRTFILSADPGKKVLFMNQEENIRVSAEEVHVTEDPSTKKQTVKGIGKVQLTFTTEEEALLKKHFHDSESS